MNTKPDRISELIARGFSPQEVRALIDAEKHIERMSKEPALRRARAEFAREIRRGERAEIGECYGFSEGCACWHCITQLQVAIIRRHRYLTKRAMRG